MKYLKRFVTWWIDKRQIANGEFGGGLSDDGDLTNTWPGTALMGIEPDKINRSVLSEMDSFYSNGMFTNGLSTIQTDELHTYEEGIQVLPQAMLVDYADPKQVERIMETAKALERITGVNAAGHRHIRSSFYGGTKMAEESVWEISKPYSYLVLHPAMSLVEYNGNPAAKKLLLELADGLLAHRRKDERGNWTTDTTINFRTDESSPSDFVTPSHLMWAAFRWTGDRKYLQPIIDRGPGALGAVDGNALDIMGMRETWGAQIAKSTAPAAGNDLNRHIAWQVTGNKAYLEGLYADQMQAAALREYINTEGHLWSDRVSVQHGELQRARLGGIAIVRSAIYPGHSVSWRFKAPATGESAAILIPDATPTGMKIIAYNLEAAPVTATMTAWDIDPGMWEVVRGIDSDGDDAADRNTATSTVSLERTGNLELVLEPKATTIVTLKLKEKGIPYWSRPDLGISSGDVKAEGKKVRVRIHSIGSVDSPATTVALRDAQGKIIASAPVPAIKAPVDLVPKTADVTLSVPSGAKLDGCTVCIDPDGKLKEITTINNTAVLVGR